MNRSSKSTASSSQIRILITTGDPDGIGWEVTAKALNALGPRTGVQFVFFRHALHLIKKPTLSRRFRVRTVARLRDVAQLPFDAKTLIEVRNTQPAALWVEDAAKACLRREFQALCTAPLSKTSIIEAGLSDIGHTEILARISGKSELFMGFVGRKFAVLLATGHRPLREALSELSLSQLTHALGAAKSLRRVLPPARRRLPIALVGVNPHAGEGGLIGREEGWMRGLTGADVHGPLVPDAAFLPKFWKSYSVYVCPYHDQGLIPFKLVHGFRGGVHLTLGLPFVRTSVDHGTAKDLFGRGQADAGSMKEALLTAIRLAKENA